MTTAFELVIPASTSNIGPGYDTLGMALKMYNRLKVEPGGKGITYDFASDMKDIVWEKVQAMIAKTVAAFMAKTGLKQPGAKLTFVTEVPIARGLGSSATFRMGALIALNRLTGEPLKLDDLLNIGCSIEKHTENCVASSIGGLTASGFIGVGVRHASFPISPDLTFVAAIPSRTISTAEVRKLVPRRISMKDAVANLNRTALLLHALCYGETTALDELLDDRFHQPYRAKVITPLFPTIEAAKKAGAWGGFLSGSGSTIIAIATDNMEKIGQAMKKTLESRGWPSTIRILKPEIQGIHDGG